MMTFLPPLSLALSFTLTLLFIVCTTSSKIPLSSESVTDIFALNGATPKAPAQQLLDEQTLAGDPLNDPFHAGICVTPWNPSWNADWYPVNAPSFPGPESVIDLAKLYDITNICVYYGTAHFNATLKFFKSNPFGAPVMPAMHLAFAYGAWDINAWNCKQLDFASKPITAQLLSLSLFNSPGTSLFEFVVYGTPAQAQSPPPLQRRKRRVPTSTSALPRTLMGMLMGTNGFGWTPMNNLTDNVGTLREYQDWQFTEGGTGTDYAGYPNDQNRFQCSAQGGFCLDDVYSNASKYNLHWHQCLQETPNWLHAYNASRAGWKPIADDIFFNDGATVDPNSYIMVADHIWQATARYGRNNAVPVKELKLAPNVSTWDSAPQPVFSGANWLNWVEIYNEPNCWWKSREVWFSATEHAAMQSAAYDGHCESMPDTKGVKQVDTTMQVSLGALANDSLIRDRWQTLYWWSAFTRTSAKCVQMFPADAVNVHFYAQNPSATIGISPEDYNVMGNLQKLADWRDRFVPEVELWVTEYGYDSHAGSPQSAPSIGQFTAQQVQGMWIMRTVLAMAAVVRSGGGGGNGNGVQRAHQFMWADVNSDSSGMYATSGLVDGSYKAKDSFYYFVCMYRTLNESYFVSRDCSAGNGGGNVCVQAFEDRVNNQNVFAVWCPSSTDQRVSSFQLQVGLNNGRTTAMLMTPVVGNADCQSSTLTVNSGGYVSVNVNELPQFVVT